MAIEENFHKLWNLFIFILFLNKFLLRYIHDTGGVNSDNSD
jgi:hypothetical protein